MSSSLLSLPTLFGCFNYHIIFGTSILITLMRISSFLAPTHSPLISFMFVYDTVCRCNAIQSDLSHEYPILDPLALNPI
jgi:hypothetical protein